MMPIKIRSSNKIAELGESRFFSMIPLAVRTTIEQKTTIQEFQKMDTHGFRSPERVLA
jgi:hypothetical protein